MYQIRGLVKKYNNPPLTALNHIDLVIPKGSVFGLLGPNGAGKTTLLSILVGLIPKTHGQVLFDGEVFELYKKEARANIGFVPQELAFYPTLTAKQNLNFFAGILGLNPHVRKSQFEFCVETTGLTNHLNKKAQHFSGGLKRRLNLAIGLLNQPKLLCLDEPTVGIDPHSRNFILETISELNRQGKTIIYTSHYMEEVEKICDYVAIIDQGAILLEGKTNDLLKNQADEELKIQFSKIIPPHISNGLQQFKVTNMDEKQISIETTRPTSVINQITVLLAESDVEIERIHYGVKNLEELFLTLTNKHLRDGLND